MKKLFLLTMTVLVYVVCANLADADCDIGIAWTPDPLAVTQDVVHNPDGVVNNGDEVVKTSLGSTGSQYQWTDTGTCPVANTIYINTIYAGGVSMKSSEFIVLDVVGAILNNAVKVDK